jgi:hypothetical protein
MGITFNYTDKEITVTRGDEKSTVYKDADTYLKDYPERATDCVAIGWVK